MASIEIERAKVHDDVSPIEEVRLVVSWRWCFSRSSTLSSATGSSHCWWRWYWFRWPRFRSAASWPGFSHERSFGSEGAGSSRSTLVPSTWTSTFTSIRHVKFLIKSHFLHASNNWVVDKYYVLGCRDANSRNHGRWCGMVVAGFSEEYMQPRFTAPRQSMDLPGWLFSLMHLWSGVWLAHREFSVLLGITQNSIGSS